MNSKLFLLLAAALVLAPFGVRDGAGVSEPAENPKLTVVYLHGFGGVRENPAFCERFREFLSETGQTKNCEVRNYEWDSVKVDILKAGASWRESEKRADEEASRYRVEVIEKLEKAGEPYVLVGYSVGTRVILRALEQIPSELKHLKAIYFLGSAMTRDTTLAKKLALPEGMKIVNYHSPTRDKVHAISFNFMNTDPAGGQAGFKDETVFENYAVSCAHAHKGVGVHIDYSQLAVAIGYLELHRAGIRIPGDISFNIETAVMEGDSWWNKIHRVESPSRGMIEIEQHNMRADYFRALRVDKEGKRRRIARGGNLHAILDLIAKK